MAEVVVIGAGLSGTLMAYELLPQLRKEDRLTVVSQGPVYHFVPSNPWVAIGWRKRSDIEIDLIDIMKRKGIRLLTQGAQRVHPAENRVELSDGTSIDYDYLVVATGPELAFDEIPGLGPDGHTQSICHVDHATHAKEAFEKLAANPGPVVIGAVQGASCFGPAYEFLFILETELRRRKLRDRVPMTFVTSEPYIGHLGLDGVGDTKGLLESEMREKHIKWITNARVKNVEPGKMSVEEVADDGSVRKTPRTAVRLFDDAAGVPRRRRRSRHREADQSARLRHHRQAPAQSGIPQRVRDRRLRGDRAGRRHAGAGRRAEDRLHDRIDGDGDGLQHRRAAARRDADGATDLERGLPRRFRRFRRRLPGAAADPAAQRQLVVEGRMGALAKVAFEKYFLRKIRRGESEPFYERFLLDKLNIAKIKEVGTREHECRPKNRLRTLRQDQPAARRAGAGERRAADRAISLSSPAIPIEVDEAAFGRHVAHSEIPVLVDVWAPWCGPCRAMAPMFERAAQALEPNVRLLKLNSDQAPTVSSQLGISGIPTLLLMQGGREISRISGAMDAQEIVAWTKAGLARS